MAPLEASEFTPEADIHLQEIRGRIRAHPKAQRISAIATAAAAGISRVTLHRIEKGEPSVNAGAYASAASALGLALVVVESKPRAGSGQVDRKGWLPSRVRIHDYPQLARLAWQLHGTETLTPSQAFALYERNWRHVEVDDLTTDERQLVEALRIAFSEDHRDV